MKNYPANTCVKDTFQYLFGGLTVRRGSLLTGLVHVSVLVPLLIGPTLVLPTLHPLVVWLLVQVPRGASVIITYRTKSVNHLMLNRS